MSTSRGSTWLDELWAGLSAGSAASFFGAVVVCALEIVACCVVFQPQRLVRIHPAYLMETTQDGYPTLTQRLLALRLGKTARGLHVAYLGGSQATRALDSEDPAVVGRELSRAAGAPVTFDLLSSNNQRLEEALAITDQLPAAFSGAVVLLVSDHKDDYGRKDRDRTRDRIAVIDTPTLEPFWAEEGYAPSHSGIFFYDHLGFFAARRIAALRLVPADVWPERRPTAEVLEQRRRAAMRMLREKGRRAEDDDDDGDQLHRRLHEQAPFFTTSRRVVAKLVESLRARGIPLVFIACPENPLRVRVFGERVERFRREMTEFARDNDAEFWVFDEELDLEPIDFQDEIHLGSKRARRRFERLFVRRLGAHLAERFPEQSND